MLEGISTILPQMPGFVLTISSLVEKIMDAIQAVLAAPIAVLLEATLGGDMVSWVTAPLSLNGDNLTQFYTIIDGVFNVVRPLGYALIITYFIFHIIGISSRGEMSLESLVKAIATMVAAAAIAANSKQIINAILELGEGVFNAIPDTTLSETTVDYQAMAEGMIDGLSLGMILFLFIVLLILFLLEIVIRVGITLAAYSRLIEIGWRAAFMPVGIADLFSGGAQSNGVRYVRSFIASVLSGAVMLIVVEIGSSLSIGVLSGYTATGGIIYSLSNLISGISNPVKTLDVIFSLLSILAIQLSTLGAAISMPQKTKEIVG